MIADVSSYKKERYAKLREEGRCVDCKRILTPEEAKFTRCPECRKHNAEASKYLRLKNAGKCVDCEKVLTGVDVNFVRCEPCRERRKAILQAKRETQENAGDQVETSEEKKDREKELILRRMAAGLCVNCGIVLFGAERMKGKCVECEAKEREIRERENAEKAQIFELRTKIAMEVEAEREMRFTLSEKCLGCPYSTVVAGSDPERKKPPKLVCMSAYSTCLRKELRTKLKYV